MRISDWSSDVCSSDLTASASNLRRRPLAIAADRLPSVPAMQRLRNGGRHIFCDLVEVPPVLHDDVRHRDVELLLDRHAELAPVEAVEIIALGRHRAALRRSEEHTSELQSLMRTSYAVSS